MFDDCRPVVDIMEDLEKDYLLEHVQEFLYQRW